MNGKVLFDEAEEEADAYDSESIFTVHEYGIDVWSDEGPEIWLATTEDGGDTPGEESGVDHIFTSRTLKNIAICENQFETGAVGLVRLKTCGGDWTQGMAIHNAIRYSSLKWVMLNYTEARSMSSLIFLAGNYRMMMPDSMFMFHTGTFSGEFTGTQIDTEYAQWKRNQERMLELYCEAMNEPGAIMAKCSEEEKKGWLNEQMKAHEEVYLDATDAVAYGFAHGIFEGDWAALRDFDEVDDPAPE